MLSLFSQENFPYCWRTYIYATPARMGSQRRVLMESVRSAQIAWCRSPTGMSVKTSYTIVRGLDGIPHEMKTQRPQFTSLVKAKGGKLARSFATRKRGLDDFYITRGESVSLFFAAYTVRKSSRLVPC